VSLESGTYFAVSHNDSVMRVDHSDWPVKGLNPSFGEWRPPVKKYTFSNHVELLVYPIIVARKNFDGPLLIPFIPYPKSLNIPESRNILRFEYRGGVSAVDVKSINGISVEADRVNKTASKDTTVVLLTLTDEFAEKDVLEISFACGEEKQVLVFERRRFTNYIPFFIPL
jgi:hypothetical protein